VRKTSTAASNDANDARGSASARAVRGVFVFVFVFVVFVVAIERGDPEG
jgi:hypothetical protein